MIEIHVQPTLGIVSTVHNTRGAGLLTPSRSGHYSNNGNQNDHGITAEVIKFVQRSGYESKPHLHGRAHREGNFIVRQREGFQGFGFWLRHTLTKTPNGFAMHDGISTPATTSPPIPTPKRQ